MKLKIILISIVFALFSMPFMANSAMRGPLFTRDQVLHQFIFYQFYPLKAKISGTNKKSNLIADLSHSNIIRLKQGYSYDTYSDYALTHLTLNYAYRIFSTTELTINTGILEYWGGFLDSFVHEFHTTFNFPDGQRKFKKDYDTEYYLGGVDYSIVNRKNSTTSLRDTSLMVRQELIKTGKSSSFPHFVVTLAAGLELPTGNVKKGTSNGSLDYGAGLYIEKGFLERQLYLYILESYMILGNYKSEGKQMPTYGSKLQHSFTLEYLPKQFKAASFLVQLEYANSPYKKTKNLFLDTDPFLLLFGINFMKSKTHMFQFSFSEDLGHKTEPDFTLQFAFFMNF